MRKHPRAQRLQVLLDMAEREEQQRLRVWGELQQKLQAEQQQRQQLISYNQEYQQQISAPGGGPLQAGLLHATLGFMQQIEQALNKQSEKLALLQQQTERARLHYLEQNSKVRALQGLMDRLDQEHVLAEGKQQQKMADEWANRAAALKMKS